MESSSGGHNLPKIQIFHPTMDEFKDFSRYIEFIELQGAHKAGLAKVVPPKEWIPRKCGYDNIDMTIPAPILQSVSGNKGLYTTYNIQQKPMLVKDFEKLANDDGHRTPRHSDFDELERKFWKNVTFNPAIYGADISGSLYDKEQSIWNINRLGTILDHVSSDYSVTIEGVNTAYLYFGMWKTSFCWHTEDMDLYSINYLHYGAPKSWYAIPPEHGRRLERLAAGFFPNEVKMCPAFLRHKTTHISPHVLRRYSIPFNRMTQEAGEFMITFPYSYHAGFNHGYNCAESTNFASVRWIEYGKRCLQCLCNNDMVHIGMDCFIKKYQPDRYDLWKAGLDYGAHPEDDQSKMYSRGASAKLANPPVLPLANLPSDPVDQAYGSHRVSRRHPVIAQTLPDKKADEFDESMPVLTAEVRDTRLDENPNFAGISLNGHGESSEPQKRKSSREGKSEKRVKRKQEVGTDGKDVETEVAEGLKVEEACGSVALSTVDCPERFWSGASETMPVLVPSDHSYTSAEFPRMLNSDGQTTWGSYCSATSTASTGFLGNTVPSFRISEASNSQTAPSAFGKHGCRSDMECFLPSAESRSSFCHAQSSQAVDSGGGLLAAASSCGLTSGSFDLLPELKDEDLLLISDDLLGEETVEVSDVTGLSSDGTTDLQASNLASTVAGIQQKNPKKVSKQDGKIERCRSKKIRDGAAKETVLAAVRRMCPRLSSVAELFQILPENPEAEVEFNWRASQTEPFCSICLLLAHNAGKVIECTSSAGSNNDSLRLRPSASKPLTPEALFGSCANRPEQLIWGNIVGQDSVVGSTRKEDSSIGSEATNGSRGESPLLTCSRCRVCVHAACYGETVASSKGSAKWSCDRCLVGTFADVCCLCALRGGALKRTPSTGRWAHVVCALVIGEAGFEQNPITAKDMECVSKKPRCAYCHSLATSPLVPTTSQLHLPGHEGACVQCAAAATEKCSASFHVTCAQAAGLRFYISRNAQGRLHFAVKCEEHAGKEPREVESIRPVPSICRGEHVIAKHKNRRYYRCQVTGVQRQLFFRVAFRDGSHSNDTFPADIEWPHCSAEIPPAMNSAVKVRWSDGVLYDAVFKGTNDVCLYQVQFEDGSVLNLERKDVWSENEELPKKVISRMSVATETKHNLFQDEKKELSSRTRSAKLCYIRDRNFVDP